MSSSSAAGTPAPTASAPRCATAAGACCRSRSCPGRPQQRGCRQSLARMAQGLQDGLRPGGGRGPLRRRSAHLPHDGEEVRRRRRRPREGTGDGGRQVGEERPGPVRPRGGARHRAGAPGPARPARHGIPRARSRPSSRSSASPATPAATSGPSTASSPPACRASSPPATAAAARAWSSGPSTKAAAPPASATAT